MIIGFGLKRLFSLWRETVVENPDRVAADEGVIVHKGPVRDFIGIHRNAVTHFHARDMLRLVVHFSVKMAAVENNIPQPDMLQDPVMDKRLLELEVPLGCRRVLDSGDKGAQRLAQFRYARNAEKEGYWTLCIYP